MLRFDLITPERKERRYQSIICHRSISSHSNIDWSSPAWYSHWSRRNDVTTWSVMTHLQAVFARALFRIQSCCLLPRCLNCVMVGLVLMKAGEYASNSWESQCWCKGVSSAVVLSIRISNGIPVMGLVSRPSYLARLYLNLASLATFFVSAAGGKMTAQTSWKRRERQKDTISNFRPRVRAYSFKLVREYRLLGTSYEPTSWSIVFIFYLYKPLYSMFLETLCSVATHFKYNVPVYFIKQEQFLDLTSDIKVSSCQPSNNRPEWRSGNAFPL